MISIVTEPLLQEVCHLEVKTSHQITFTQFQTAFPFLSTRAGRNASLKMHLIPNNGRLPLLPSGRHHSSRYILQAQARLLHWACDPAELGTLTWSISTFITALLQHFLVSTYSTGWTSSWVQVAVILQILQIIKDTS